jgi:hypothetical protein
MHIQYGKRDMSLSPVRAFADLSTATVCDKFRWYFENQKFLARKPPVRAPERLGRFPPLLAGTQYSE